MDKLRQAAVQMLEELEIYFDVYPHMQKGYVIDAITDLRAALAEQPAEQEPVAWSVFDKRTKKHWYTHESRYTAQHYASEYSHREPDGTPHNVVVPLYTAPQPAKPAEQEPEGNVCGRCGGLVFDPVIPQPRREVELTDEEIDEVWNGLIATPDFSRVKIARSIIEAYKAKQGEMK